MITIYSCPKPFEGHIGDIQTNAIRSWADLDGPEILLLGDDDGVSEIADDLGLRHLPDIETNEEGTPRVDSLFQTAAEHASHEQLCYVNADIVLPPTFAQSLVLTWERAPKALLVGRRVNVDIEGKHRFGGGWPSCFERAVDKTGVVAPHDAIDYFAFERGTFGEIPPFAIGRFGWDNWLLYQASDSGHSIVDISERIKVVHQNHDYRDEGTQTREQEIDKNMSLLTGDPEDPTRHAKLYTLSDADHRLTEDGTLRKNRSPYRLWRRIVEASEDYPVLKPLVSTVKRVRGFHRS